MSYSQIEIQMVDNSLKDNHYWKKLTSKFAVAGLKFEIHCWRDETEEIKAALEFGKEKLTDWELGTIIEGVIDEKFINMLNHTTKPSDTKIYNKMTPFFSIFIENGFSSEHYGTEFHFLPVPVDDVDFMILLKQLREYAVVNEY